MVKIANNLAIEEFISSENSFEKKKLFVKKSHIKKFLCVGKNRIVNRNGLKIFLALLIILLFYNSKIYANTDDSIQALFSKKVSNTAEIDQINNLIGKSIAENSAKAEIFANCALHVADSMAYQSGKAKALLNIVENLKNSGNYPDALKYLLQALKIYEKLNNYEGLVICHKNLGFIYGYGKKVDQSVEQINIALDIARKHWKNEVGNCLNSLGFIYKEMNKTDMAVEYLTEALLYQKERNNINGIAKALTNIGVIYREQNKTDKALNYLREANVYFEKSGLISGQIVALGNIGFCYSQNGNFSEAIICQKKVMELAKKISDKESLGNAYYGLYNAYKDHGNYKEALINLERLQALQDSIFNSESTRKFAELSAKYENEKKEQQIKIQKLELSKKETQIYAAYLLIIVIIVFAFFGYRYYRVKQKQHLRETILSTEISERTRIAKDMHDELGSSLTKILIVSEVAKTNTGNLRLIKDNVETINSTVKDLSSNIRDFVWTLNPENATLDNLFVKLREFCADLLEEAGIEFSLDFAENIPGLEISKKAQRNIYLASKEAVNNIVKHASAKHVKITAIVILTRLKVEIFDNGKGFDISTLKTSGNGLNNIRRRIEDLGGRIFIESKPGEGTQIWFEIELENLV
jgi:signal transduction histidine kinase